jgi:ribosomal protein L22
MTDEERNESVEETPEAEATPAKKPAAKKPAAKKKDAEKPAAKKAAKKKADDGDDAAAKKPTAKKKADEGDEEAPAKKPAAKKAAKDAEPAKEAAKPARRRRDEERAVPVGLTVRAQAKYVRTSARKARLVCDHIRGKDVVEARAILAFTPRSAAKPWLKLLESAVANAEHNHELVGEELRIESVHADEGPTLKRFRPRAMGRATRIRKRTSHLTITLTPKES